MADLITHNEADYINKAVRFAKDSKKLSALKAQLNNNVENGKLFNTKIYVENIENAFIQIYNLYKLGHEAKHIFL
jgi:protein O-GlcNAc transferase